MNQRHFGGKRDSRRHSATSFSDNDVVAGTSLEVSSFCDRERAKPPPIKNNRSIFSGEK